MSMTRGEMQDVLAGFAAKNPDYRSALVRNPRAIIAKQFNMVIPDNVAIKAVEESADTIYVVVPHAVAAGAELDDADLEKVAGGSTVKGDANCNDSDGAMNTVVEINASFSLI
jgi:Nitrile hydratase, alpha chain